MNIITGKTGEPHVTAQQDREINQAIFGIGNSVLNIGSCFEAEQTGSGNTIRIKDGLLMLQGTAASIDSGAYDEVTIANGSQGVSRTDYICAKYSRNTSTGTESMTFAVLQGDSNGNPPEVPEGIIREGAVIAYFPLYSVTLNGVNISAPKQLFTIGDKKILFKGPIQMGSGVKINLSEAVSKQRTGIVLVWSPYVDNTNIHCQFIKKEAVMFFPETTHSTFLCNTAFTKVAAKSVYVHDDCILGNSYNTASGTASGITYNNADYTLRYVLGY